MSTDVGFQHEVSRIPEMMNWTVHSLGQGSGGQGRRALAGRGSAGQVQSGGGAEGRERDVDAGWWVRKARTGGRALGRPSRGRRGVESAMIRSSGPQRAGHQLSCVP